MANPVRDVPEQSRFELSTPDGTAFIAYHRKQDVLSLDHTEVPESMSGQGIGSALVKGALELIRARNQKVIPRCSFVAHYLEKHPHERELEARGGSN